MYTGSPGNNFNGDDLTYVAFRADRWKRVGADKATLEALAIAHSALTPEEQAQEGRRIASVSDDELKADLAGDPASNVLLDAALGETDPNALLGVVTPEAVVAPTEPGPIVGTVETVLDHVGQDPELAAEQLAHELENKARPTLVTALTAIAEPVA